MIKSIFQKFSSLKKFLDFAGPVCYCTIELDRDHFYPKGAACVVFTSNESYIKAIAAHVVVLSFGTFERKVKFF